jgi:hypothetical protein
MDHSQNFKGVFGGHFPCSSYGISTLWSEGAVANGFNFLSDCGIVLIFLQYFSEAIFLGVAMESLLGE